MEPMVSVNIGVRAHVRVARVARVPRTGPQKREMPKSALARCRALAHPAEGVADTGGCLCEVELPKATDRTT